jgi:hypothetical protein
MLSDGGMMIFIAFPERISDTSCGIAKHDLHVSLTLSDLHRSEFKREGFYSIRWGACELQQCMHELVWPPQYSPGKKQHVLTNENRLLSLIVQIKVSTDLTLARESSEITISDL